MSSSTTTTNFVTVSEGVDLHVTLTTPAGHVDPNIPTLLFLHFWGGSSSSFSPVINVLSPYFPTVALSFRGWGDSTGPEEIEAYTTTNSCSDVETIIQTLDLKAVVLVGHSMGGKVAMAVAGRHVVPASILKGLALLAPAPPGPLSIADPSMREQQLHAFDNTDNAEAVINTYLTAQEGPTLSNELVKSIANDMVRGHKSARTAWLVHGMPEDIGQLFDRIDVPVLVVAGGSDIIEPVERMKTEIYEKLTDRLNSKASLAIVEGSGHLLPFEKPEEVAQLVKQFAESL